MVNGAQMPPKQFNLNLTIGEYIPPPPPPVVPPPVVVIEPEPIGLPNGLVYEFKMNGEMEVNFDPAIDF